MRHPKRLLREYLDNQASTARAAAAEAHLSRCAACRAEAARERRLRSRLRTLEVPVAGPELRESIGRTAWLAADGQPASYAADPAPAASVRIRRRLLISTAGAVAAAVGLVLSTAYLLGGWTQGATLGEGAPGLAVGWTEVTGGAAGTLSGDQITDLRARGWACPELRSIGMAVVAARAARIDGEPAVVMTLEGNGSTVIVYESRPELRGESADSVVDAVSGQPAAEAGFVRREQGTGRPEVWLNPQRPGQAVLSASRVTYTVDAAPPDVLDDAVREISLTESSRLVLHAPETAQGVWDRVQRGLAIMAGSGNSP